jgi:hypothetical protein
LTDKRESLRCKVLMRLRQTRSWRAEMQRTAAECAEKIGAMLRAAVPRI